MKKCTTCGDTKDDDAFAADKRHRDGLQSRCRACHRAYQKAYAAREPEHHKALRAAEYLRRKPKVQAYQRANRERINAWARNLEMTPRRREVHRKASEVYRLRNPELCRQRIRAWQQSNPERQVDAVNRRRARQRAVAYERIDVTVVGTRDEWICGICTEPIDPSLRYPDQRSRSIDHTIPLSMGGPHLMENVRISHWICNVRRGAARGEDIAAIMAKVRAA